MKYSFHAKELNNWKARITQRLIQCYIEDVLVQTLKEQGWDDSIYTKGWFYEQTSWSEEFELKFLIANNLFPTMKFLNYFKKLTRLLKNEPDGFLFKLKIGKMEALDSALKEIVREIGSSWYSGSWSWGSYMCDFSKVDAKKLRPILDGEIEVVEVKADKGALPPNQKRSYGNILREGYVLHFFQVSIVSFEKNKFEIEEKLLTNPSDIF